jgi:methyl-accepting chemotaxis protein
LGFQNLTDRRKPSLFADQSVGDIVPGIPAVAALDSVQANVFIADRDLNLVYANPMALRTVRNLTGEIQRVFGVSAHDLLGGSIHRFHHDPARIERILHDPSALPRQAQFTFGSVTLDTEINRITDPSGQVAGYIVAWQDISEKVAAQHQAQTVTTRLAETVDKNQEVSNAIESVATAMEQMSATVNDIARNGSQASAVVSDAASVVETATRTMENLNAASERINEVVTTISQIARQTNLLALNATIEAARAGETGKGFAVVAGEVKDLSSATQDATERIGELIENIQVLSQTAAQDMTKIADIVNTARDSQSAVAVAVEQQTVTNASISRDLSLASQHSQAVTHDLAAFLESNTH